MDTLFKEAEILKPQVEKAIEKVRYSCNPFVMSGRPINSRKVSLKHVNKEFNIEMQVKFLTIKHGDEKYEGFNIVNLNKTYGERCIVGSRSCQTVMSKFEESWPCRHGALSHFSAGRESCLPFFIKYLNGHNKRVDDQPARSSHKTGRAERSNGVFKTAVEKTSKEKTKADIDLLVSSLAIGDLPSSRIWFSGARR